jgi:hypothetical protein
MWRRENWTKKWSRLQVLTLTLVLSVLLLVLCDNAIPKDLHYLQRLWQ